MTIYSERLWPAPWLFISTALVIPASLLVFAPINFQVGIVVAIVLYAGCCIALIIGSPTITVTESDLIAGKATLPLGLVGEVTAFRGEEARLERGQRLDARAWLLIRGWVSPVIKVVVLDERDPTPYWLVSTRRPEEAASAIAKASGRRE